jgi:hypothetical protein
MTLPYDAYASEIISLYDLKAPGQEHPERCSDGEGANRLMQVVASAGSHRETDDNYLHVVARLNDHYRVIRCKDDLQWIIQKRDGFKNGQPRWTARSYCVEPATINRLVIKHCGIVDAAELQKVHDLLPGGERHDR